MVSPGVVPGRVRTAVVVAVTLLLTALMLAPVAFLARGALEGGTDGVAGALAAGEVRVALGHTVLLALVVTDCLVGAALHHDALREAEADEVSPVLRARFDHVLGTLVVLVGGH